MFAIASHQVGAIFTKLAFALVFLLQGFHYQSQPSGILSDRSPGVFGEDITTK